ncbi:MAG: hypothetical protein II346_02850, partial [Ruminococcus sp.]|nr:hypothetical protein [Ruminococcus sp.]
MLYYAAVHGCQQPTALIIPHPCAFVHIAFASPKASRQAAAYGNTAQIMAIGLLAACFVGLPDKSRQIALPQFIC